MFNIKVSAAVGDQVQSVSRPPVINRRVVSVFASQPSEVASLTDPETLSPAARPANAQGLLNSTPHWYAVYTSANHERRVAQQLGLRGIEHFLPEYESVRKWKDRKIRLQMPLFPGYLFVHMALGSRLQVLQVPGVARLVGFNGTPTPLPAEDLLRVRDLLSRGFAAEPHPLLRVGRRVRVTRGPLAGLEGVIVRRKNRSRLVISFELIERAISVEVSWSCVETA